MATQYGVKAKKGLGQHFLADESIARRIVEGLVLPDKSSDDLSGGKLQQLQVLEIGPGTGVLTKYMLQNPQIKLEVCEIDTESIEYLQKTYPQMLYSLQQRDFLQVPLEKIFSGEFAVIGNFPYNISSQIFFKVLDYKETIPQVVCMLQKEVAERLASGPGNKSYGILSVLLQAWYNIEYLFTVPEHVFVPPPKVKSGVIRLTRNGRTSLGCDEVLFKKVVKTCFNQRRKTIRNSIKPIMAELGKNFTPDNTPEALAHLFELRPEQLSVEQFVELTLLISK
ncbi:MAG: 16S rRNA (adenine(1518)-N(6)/adenine(1519)-N(6))-dimethyltransferase RsmA [Bacteroidales bacterium]|nr:16S rRNA (adenine(1518)-N(6)/adenine(1519)-N(6))-dimethyltransferase RsmA [Bacteroidales bacterium]